MGHTIQHYDYPVNVDKKKVEQELANYVAKRCFQEGGHLSKIRWIDSEPCANEDEAYKKIESLDKGWYDCIAVKYYDAYNMPETEKIKFESEKHDMEDKIVLMRGLENDKSTYQKWTFGITSQETVPEEKIACAKQCLIDNGIEDDEAETVLQALCYILMDTEIFPEEEKNHE